MTIYKYTDGNIIYASEQNQNLTESLTKRALSLIRTLQDRTVIYSPMKDDLWGDAYTAAAGRMGSVNTTQTNATFSTNKYIPFVGSYYFIIEATSLTEANFAINNCQCKNIATGKWIFYSTSSTLTQKKADMIKTLFYGTTGTDERIESTYITGLTALKSNLASDVGKRVYRVTAAWTYAPPNTGGFIGYWTGTYSNTTTNTDVNAWGSVTNQNNVMVGWTGSGLSTGWAVNPLSDIGVGNSVSSDNPATVQLSFYNDGSDGLGARGGSGTGMVFTKGTITWARGQNQDFAITGFTSTTDYDYTAVGGVPLITLATETELNTITHNIPTGTFASNISTAIGIPLIVDWETGANFQFKLKNTTEDSGWLDAGLSPAIQTFTPFTAQPTTLLVKIIQKETSPTAGYPSLSGFAIRTT